MTEQEFEDKQAQEQILSRIDSLHRAQVRRRVGYMSSGVVALALISIGLWRQPQAAPMPDQLLAVTQPAVEPRPQANIEETAPLIRIAANPLPMPQMPEAIEEDAVEVIAEEEPVIALEFEPTDILAENSVLEPDTATTYPSAPLAESTPTRHSAPRQVQAPHRSFLRELFTRSTPDPNTDGTNLSINITPIFES